MAGAKGIKSCALAVRKTREIVEKRRMGEEKDEKGVRVFVRAWDEDGSPVVLHSWNADGSPAD